MDNLSTGILTATRAEVKKGLAVYLTVLQQQNLLLKLVNFRAGHKKVSSPLLELPMTLLSKTFKHFQAEFNL